MKKLLLLIILSAVPAFCQCGALTVNPITGRLDCTVTSTAPFAPVMNFGTDVICALHADTITGLACNNQVTDGTTETALATVATLQAGVLASAVTQVNLSFGLLATATLPNVTLRVHYGTISGPVIFASPTVNLTAGSRGFGMGCALSVGPLSAISAAVMNCFSTGLNALIVNNTVLNNANLSVPINTTVASQLTVTVQFSAATTQNALWLYSISSAGR